MRYQNSDSGYGLRPRPLSSTKHSNYGVSNGLPGGSLSVIKDEVYTTIHKYAAKSYGVTIVAGYPFTLDINERIREAQERIESVAPERFVWYSSDYLHATIVALLRGRYRSGLPVQQTELPMNLHQYIENLEQSLEGMQPFTLELLGIKIGETGVVAVDVRASETSGIQELRNLLMLDQPQHNLKLHISIGYLNTPQPFSTRDEYQRFEQEFTKIKDSAIALVDVEQVWLVHYSNRMLNQVVGKMPLQVGRSNQLTAERLLKKLRIS